MMKYWENRLAWLFMTPLGRPVVPPVYMMTQVSSGVTSTSGSAGLAFASICS